MICVQLMVIRVQNKSRIRELENNKSQHYRRKPAKPLSVLHALRAFVWVHQSSPAWQAPPFLAWHPLTAYGLTAPTGKNIRLFKPKKPPTASNFSTESKALWFLCAASSFLFLFDIRKIRTIRGCLSNINCYEWLTNYQELINEKFVSN